MLISFFKRNCHLSPFIAWVEKNPRCAFVLFIVFHGLVWTILPALCCGNLPANVIEALLYGREWQIGYDKLPPLPWYIVEVTHLLINSDFAYFALSQIAIISAFILVFATALPIVGSIPAFVAILIVDGCVYFHIAAIEFNHNVIQLPLWALVGYSFRMALNQNKFVYWLLLGLGIGLSFWAKYFFVVLVFPLVVFLVSDPTARKTLATRGPWVALIVALIVMSPHLFWLMNNYSLAFSYANGRSMSRTGIFSHVLYPTIFLLSQGIFMSLAVLIAMPLWSPLSSFRRQFKIGASLDKRIITLLAFGPGITVICLSMITGRGLLPAWGWPLWLFIGVWIVMYSHYTVNREQLTRVIALWGFSTAFFVVAMIGTCGALSNDFIVNNVQFFQRVTFPGELLARETTDRYLKITKQPLLYVIANKWDGGNLSHYSSEHPRVLIDGLTEHARWIDVEDVKKRGL